MNDIRIGDLVDWTKNERDPFDDARGGTGTVALIDGRKITIEAVKFPRQEVVRFTFRLDEITLKKVWCARSCVPK